MRNIQLTKAQKSIIFVLGVLLAGAISFLDYKSGPRFSFLIFYFIPVIGATWFLGARAGIAMGLISVTSWLAIEYLWPPNYPNPLIPYWKIVRGVSFLLVTILISFWRRIIALEHQWSMEDPLTGLANRRSFFQEAQREIDRAKRYSRPLTLAFIDIDNFKRFNDQNGHSEGDLLLSLIGESLRGRLRSMDVAARMGGDEFVIILPEITASSASHAINNIFSQLSRELSLKRKKEVTFSVGAVTFIEVPNTVDRMLREADSRMYAVKKSGKNNLEHHVLAS
jgi:diguanylate cyclase (GGDEF)-like protein